MTDEAARVLLSLDVPEDVAARHLARLLTVRPGGTVVPLRRRAGLRATAAGLVLGATLASGAGVAAASTANPGDTLYGLKTAREHLQLTMARHGDTRARLELKLARTRLGEAAALLQHGNVDRAIATLARADAALAAARAQGGDGIDLDAANELDHRVDVLTSLLNGGLPDTAADAAREALQRAIERGANPAGTHGDHGQPGTHGNGPGDHPATPATHSTPPSHPGKDNHPTGKPTAPPGRP